MKEIKIITNNVPRDIIYENELTAREREDFEYLDWHAFENGQDSEAFVRYKGSVYLLRDFSADWSITKGGGMPEHLKDWHGYLSDSFCSALVIRFVEGERVVIGLVLS